VKAMKSSEKVFVRRAAAVSCAALLAAVLLAPSHSFAWTSSSSHHRSYRSHNSHSSSSSYDYDARYLQDQAISAAEEARREKGREKRREEVAQESAQNTSAYLASKAATRDASRAASRAPRDAFYRKPGTVAATLPPNSAKVEVAGETYHYSRGLFYKDLAGKYLVVPAPVGAVVDALPEGTGGASYEGNFETYSYYFGTFFAEENGKFKVVAPPPGTLVGYIPDGYNESEVEETREYEFGSITYRPAFYGNETVYEVVKS
jgi:hypothetical protein